MALATRCPHCNTIFRVAADQLKLRGGIVRCGACKEVFDGNAMLVDLEAPAAAPEPAPAPAAEPEQFFSVTPEAEVPAETALPPSDIVPEPVETTEPEAEPVAEAEPVTEAEPEPEAVTEDLPTGAPAVTGVDQFYTLDFDTAIDPASVAPQQEAEPEQEQEQEAESEPEPPADYDIRLRSTPLPEVESAPFDLPSEEQIVAAALPDDGHPFDDHRVHPDPDAPDPALLLTRESAPGGEIEVAESQPRPAPLPVARKGGRKVKPRPAPRPQPVPEPEPEPAEPEHEEPEFVRRVRLKEEKSRTRQVMMAVGSVVLLLALSIQALTTFRNVLAAQFPSLKPVLVSGCAAFGCRVELPAQIDALVIETGELETVAGDSYLFTTMLHNQGGLVQAWPHVELALTDADNKTVLRRVFAPAEYLPKDVAPAKGFAARSEQPVRLYFKLDQIKASGYHIAVFYP